MGNNISYQTILAAKAGDPIAAGAGARNAIVTWWHCGSAIAMTCGGVRYLRWLCFTA